MRRICLLMGGATLALAACSTKKTAVNDDLKKDLELASSSDGIAVGSGATNQGLQVVSAIERTAPAPKAPAPAPSSKVHKHHKAPDAPPASIVAEAPATVTTSELAPVTTAPVAVDPAPPVSPRPQVVNYPVGDNPGTINRRPSAGEIIGAVLGAVLRGAVIGGDACDPRTDGRQRLPAAVNRRW